MYKEGEMAIVKTQKYSKNDDSVCHLFKAGSLVKVTSRTANWIWCKNDAQMEQCLSEMDLCPVNQSRINYHYQSAKRRVRTGSCVFQSFRDQHIGPENYGC